MTDAQTPRSAPRPASAIRASVLLPVLRALEARPGTAEALLARHGLSRPQLADPYALVPLAAYLAVFEAAAQALGDPLLGARLGAAFKPADIGPTGLLFSASPTIRRAFEGLARSINALQGGTAATLLPAGAPDEVVWTYRIVDRALGARRQDSEFTLSATCQLVRASFSPHWSPIEVHLEHGPPPEPAALQRLFGAPLRFNRPANRLVMAAGPLDRVHRADDGGLTQVLLRHIAELQKAQGPQPDLQSQVRRLIGAYLGQLPVSIPAFARELGLSPRTLQRRLAAEGTSLRELVRLHRAEIARQGLEEEHARCGALADQLGYADGTVFWRAYKSWTGRSPSGRSRAS